MDKICPRCGEIVAEGSPLQPSVFTGEMVCEFCERAESYLPEYNDALERLQSMAEHSMEKGGYPGLPALSIRINAKTTCYHSEDKTISWNEWRNLVLDGEIPDVKGVYERCAGKSYDDSDCQVVREDGGVLIDWDY